MIRIFHCADIHLDSPFSADTPERAAHRRRQLRRTFSSMVEYAKNRDTDLFLICGDLFDREYVTYDTAAFVCKTFESAPQMRFFILPGNHDPYAENSVYRKTAFPPNVTVFCEPELQRFHLEDIGADVYGYAFHSARMDKNPFADKQPENESCINLLLAHGSLNAPNDSVCPISEADIANSGFDYYAFGHYHNTDGIHQMGRKWYGYSGCPQGRDFGETGYKGAVVADLVKENGIFSAKTEQIRFCADRYEVIRCNLTGAQSADEVCQTVDRELRAQSYGTDTVLRLILEGSPMPDARHFICRIRSSWQDTLAQLEIVDNTQPPPDCSSLETDPSLRGAFYLALKEDLLSSNEAVRQRAVLALRYGLAILDGTDPDFE